jgi:DNA-binding GntR family transcriptional regulator
MSEPVRSATLEHLSLPESVHRLLRRQILNNEGPAGSRLIEANLALELGVSRSTVRQALRQLAHEGLVEINPRRGSVVTRLSLADIQDACCARYVLEAGAARAVLAHGVQKLIEPMTKVLHDMAAAAERGDGRRDAFLGRGPADRP